MKRVLGFALAAALCAAGSPALGQFFGTPQGNTDIRIQQTQIRLQAAQSRRRSATEQLDRTQKQYDAGTVSQAEYSNAQLGVAQANSEVAQIETELKGLTEEKRKEDRITALRRPVSVELRDAPVRQAAQVLSQASGVQVNIDKGVPTDKRLTVVAQAVPLATVLDTVARQTGLEIAPEGDGVLLKSSPALEVNGQRTEVMSPFAPWSSDWETNPAASMVEMGGYRQVLSVLPDGSHVYKLLPATSAAPATPLPEPGGGPAGLGQAYQAAPPPGYEGAPGFRGPSAPGQAHQAAPQPGFEGAPGFAGPPGALVSPYPAPEALGFGGGGVGGFGAGGLGGWGGGFAMGGGGTLPVTMTALSSNTFVVASPAPGGEPAVTLTVYRLEGSELRRISSTLHRLSPAGSARTGAGFAPVPVVPYGYPGTPRGAAPRPHATDTAPGVRFAPVPDALPGRPGAAGPLPRSDAPRALPPDAAPAPPADSTAPVQR